MNLENPILFVILGVLAVIAVAWAVRRFFSAEARRERRRRRSNSRLASTAKRPMVRFSVRARKDRRK
jgi:peptidoglycan/LPS O-acetylase OafA/YrhL